MLFLDSAYPNYPKSVEKLPTIFLLLTSVISISKITLREGRPFLPAHVHSGSQSFTFQALKHVKIRVRRVLQGLGETLTPRKWAHSLAVKFNT